MPEASDESVRRYYDDFSESYDRVRASAYHRMLDDLALAILTPYAQGGRALELGCGTGVILSQVSEIAAEAVGIDLSMGMATRARARGLDVRIADVCNLPFRDDSFDVIYSFRVLPHVSNIRGAIMEAVRVTRPGGHLLLELYNPWSLRYLAKKVAGPRPISDSHTEADVVTRWHSPRAIHSLLPAGVEVLDAHGLRVVTPFAGIHRIPVLGLGVRWAERLSSHSPLKYLGGFFVVVLRKS